MQKISIKREQSQAGLSFAEREKFRPQVKNKLFLLLVLLLTAVTGAWAQVFRLPTVRQMENSRQLSITDMPKRANGLLRAPVQDDHGIITTPDEGVTKYYTRAGTGYYVSNNSVYNEDQSGIVTIVEAEGGKVYIKDPVSHYNQSTWVVGTKAGNTITVAAAQPLLWNASYSTTLSLNWGNVQATQTGNTYVRGEGDITFTVDDQAGTITLDGSSSDKIIGVFWDDDNSWSGYGDYSTVWTLNTEYQPASTDPIVLPDGAEVQNWYADGAGSTAVPTDVKVAFVGNEVYISGLTSNFPDAWIKGTIDGTTVTFSKFQFVGMYNNTMPIWAVGADSQTGALQDFTMTYDAEAQTLALDANQLIVFNAAEDRMYYLSYIESLTISAEEPVPAVIETLPYVNSFDTAADQKQFTIIDANEDGRTWNWYSGQGRYTYSQTNAGDDWLVSPGINLVAGKKYSFSIDAHAQSSTYPERLEVKMAKEGTAVALAAGAQLIESTVINSAQYITLSNSEFTVSETGQYRIGIHAISDQDKYYLYVDNFKVDMLVSPGYNVSLKEGTVDAGNWSIEPKEGLSEGDQVTIQYNGRLKVKGVKATSDAAEASVPDGAINGKFSVSDSKQVYFSKGNLRYASSKWSFFDNQYDYYTSYSADTWDKFGWSTSATTYGMNTSEDYNDYSGNFVDWGATMGTGWFTLSSAEWTYLFNTRSASTVGGTENGRYAKAKVNNVPGVIFFPDTYTHPDGVTAPTGVNSTGDTGWNGNSYSSADWTKMESAGCVFLPAAGYRYGSTMENAGALGNYWSATPNGTDYAYCVAFGSGNQNPAYDDQRGYGFSVRLVREVATTDAEPAKTPATVTTAPTGAAIVGVGKTTALVSGGVAEGGTMMYKVTTENTKPASTDGFSEAVPTAQGITASGKVYVWYYVKGDDTHTDSEIAATAIEVPVADIVWDATNVSDLEIDGPDWDEKEGIKLSCNAEDVSAVWSEDEDPTLNGISFRVQASGGLTFTAPTGKKFTKIEMNAVYSNGWDGANLGTGWTFVEDAPNNIYKATWTGSASSTVDLLKDVDDFGGEPVKSIAFYLSE